MTTSDYLLWVIESIPGAAVIGVMVTLATAIVFDIELEFASLSGTLLLFLPGFVAGMLIMMVVGYFLGSLLGALARVLFGSAGADRR